MTQVAPSNTAPSAYEQAAWNDLISGRARPSRRAIKSLEEGTGKAVTAIAESEAWKRIAEGAGKAGAAVSKAVPDGAKDAAKGAAKAVGSSAPVEWIGEAAKSTSQTVMRVSRVGLTPEQLVKSHQKKGHEVERLLDVRVLDLELVDKVRGRNVDLAYAFVGAASGAGTGLMITGGEVGVGTGVNSGPGAGVVAGAMALDLAAVIALSSRAVGQVSLAYGYDPEDASEKAFVASVVNFSTATTTAAKSAAFADVARLSQLLIRGQSWAKLNESVLTRLAQAIAKQIGARFTKKSLGKLIPVVGVVVGAGMNFATLEGVVDSANIAYRRRFLLEKYPHLNEDGDLNVVERFADQIDDTLPDEVITVAEELTILEESGEE